MIYEVKKQYVYLSFCAQDKQDALNYARVFENSGYAILFDDGNENADNVARAIKNCSLFVTFLSVGALSSQKVRRELYYAVKKERSHCVVYLENVENSLDDGMEFLFGTARVMRAYMEKNEKKESMVCRKEDLVVEERQMEPAPVATEYDATLLVELGEDKDGKIVHCDICKMSSTLICGSVGTGKTTFLRRMIFGLMTKYRPEQCKLLLLASDCHEYEMFLDSPQLLVNEIVNESEKVERALDWIELEIERRFVALTRKDCGNIDFYNASVTAEERLAKIVVVLDGLDDFMLVSNNIAGKIDRLMKKSYRAGIYFLVSTKCFIKSMNDTSFLRGFMTKISFSTSDMEMKKLFDSYGMANTLDQWEMFYRSYVMTEPVKLKTPYISMGEIEKAVANAKEQSDVSYDFALMESLGKAEKDESFKTSNVDEASKKETEEGTTDSCEGGLLVEALRFAIETGTISISMIQRHFSCGYNKAGRMIEWMEKNGYITTYEGVGHRSVLLTKEEFEEKYCKGNE